jgi:hypothetical protein
MDLWLMVMLLDGCVVAEDFGRAASNEVAVVAAVMVVAHEPGSGLGLELTNRGEPAPVEGGAPAFLED